MSKFLSFLSGALLGATIGATIALLLTPASGEDLRAQIEERRSYIETEVRKAAQEKRAELEAQLAHLRA
ncbi:MAG: hypothetical protein OHK0052_08810 [Anaerolineales bacterium]